MRRTTVILGTILFALTAMAADFDGTWKVDLAKSRPATALASETMKIEATAPGAHRTTIDGALKSGQTIHQEIDRIYDGKERPVVTKGVRPGLTEICVQIDASTRRITQKRDGQVSELTSTVSPDGKTLTVVRTGKGAETLVFQRQ